jgi:hypothetical protein
MSLLERRRQCVVDHSVYNMLSMSRRDLPVTEIVNRLRAAWQPAWDTPENVVTVDSVRAALDRLEAQEFVKREGEQAIIPIRDPQTNMGRYVAKNRERTALL